MALEYGFGFEGGAIPSGVVVLQGDMRPGVGRLDPTSWGLVDSFAVNGAAEVEIQVPKVATPVTQAWYEVYVPDQKDSTYRFLDHITVVRDSEFKMMIRNPDVGDGSLIEHYASTNLTGNGTNETALRDLLSRIDGIVADNISTSGLCAVSGREITSVYIADYLGGGPKYVINITIRRNNVTHLRYDSSTSSPTTGRYPFYFVVNQPTSSTDVLLNYKNQSFEDANVLAENIPNLTLDATDIQYSITQVNSRNVACSYYTRFNTGNITATPFYLATVGDMGIAVWDDSGTHKLRFTFDTDDAGNSSSDVIIPTIDTGWHSLHFNFLLGTPSTHAVTIYWDTEEVFKISPAQPYGTIEAGPNYGGFDKLILKGLPGTGSTIDDVRVEKEFTRGMAPSTIQCVKTSFVDSLVNQWSPKGTAGIVSTGLSVRGMEYCPATNRFYAINNTGVIYEIHPETYASTVVNTVDSNYGHCALVYHAKLNRIYMVRNGFYSYFTPGQTTVTEVADANCVYEVGKYNSGSTRVTKDGSVCIVSANGYGDAYTNPMGTGNRADSIFVTSSGLVFSSGASDLSVLVDGVQAAYADSTGKVKLSVDTPISESTWFRFEFPYGINPTQIRFWGGSANVSSLGTWKYQGWDSDLGQWDDISSSFSTPTVNTTPQWYTTTCTATKYYKTLRMLGVSGTWNGYQSNYLGEFEFSVTGISGQTNKINAHLVSPTGTVTVVASDAYTPNTVTSLSSAKYPHLTCIYDENSNLVLFPLWSARRVAVVNPDTSTISFSADEGYDVRWITEAPAMFDQLGATSTMLAISGNTTSRTRKYDNGAFSQYSTLQLHAYNSLYDRGLCYHPWIGMVQYSDNTTPTTISHILKSSGRVVTGPTNAINSTDVFTGKINPITGAMFVLTSAGTLNAVNAVLGTSVANLLVKDSKFVEESGTGEKLVPILGHNIPATKIALASTTVVQDSYGQGLLDLSGTQHVMTRTKKSKTGLAVPSEFESPSLLLNMDAYADISSVRNLGTGIYSFSRGGIASLVTSSAPTGLVGKSMYGASTSDHFTITGIPNLSGDFSMIVYGTCTNVNLFSTPNMTYTNAGLNIGGLKAGTGFSSGVWQYILIRRNAGTLTVHINGNLAFSGTDTTTINMLYLKMCDGNSGQAGIISWLALWPTYCLPTTLPIQPGRSAVVPTITKL